MSGGRASATMPGLSQGIKTACFITTVDVSFVTSSITTLEYLRLDIFKSASTDRSKLLSFFHAAEKDQLAPTVRGTNSPAALHHFKLIFNYLG